MSVIYTECAQLMLMISSFCFCVLKKKKKGLSAPTSQPQSEPVSLEPCRAWEAFLWALPVLLVPGQCQRRWQWPFVCPQALLPSCLALSWGAGTLSDMGGRVGG